MSDLSAVYSSYDFGGNGGYVNDGFSTPFPQGGFNNVPQQSTQIPKATASHAMPPDPPYNPPAEMYAQQTSKATPQYINDSFWDRLVTKKMEVIKFMIMGLIIVFALGIDSVSSHYLSSYITKSFLTEGQEMLVRVSYPLAVLLLIWVIKANV